MPLWQLWDSAPHTKGPRRGLSAHPPCIGYWEALVRSGTGRACYRPQPLSGGETKGALPGEDTHGWKRLCRGPAFPRRESGLPLENKKWTGRIEEGKRSQPAAPLPGSGRAGDDASGNGGQRAGSQRPQPRGNASPRRCLTPGWEEEEVRDERRMSKSTRGARLGRGASRIPAGSPQRPSPEAPRLARRCPKAPVPASPTLARVLGAHFRVQWEDGPSQLLTEQARACARGRSPELECSAGVWRNPREAFQPAQSAAGPTADARLRSQPRGARSAHQACPRRAGENPGRQQNRQNRLPLQAELLWRLRGHSVGRRGGRAWSLGREEPLEKGMAARSSRLACRIPWAEEPGGLQSTGHTEPGTTEWLTVSLSHCWCNGNSNTSTKKNWGNALPSEDKHSLVAAFKGMKFCDLADKELKIAVLRKFRAVKKYFKNLMKSGNNLWTKRYWMKRQKS